MNQPSDSGSERNRALLHFSGQLQQLIFQSDALGEYVVSAHLCQALDRVKASGKPATRDEPGG